MNARTCARLATRQPSHRSLLLRLVFGALLVVFLAGLTQVADTARAAAAPTPAPTPAPPGQTPTPSPTGSPTTPGNPSPSPSDNPFCGGTVPNTVQRWCFSWVRYAGSPPQGAPSHWVTACAQLLTTDQLAQCQAVALTLDDRPKDGTATVLTDVAPGTPSKPELVRCDAFAQRAAADPGNANRWAAKQGRCLVAARTLSFQLRDPGVTPGPPTAPPTTPPSTPPSHHEKSCGLTDVSCQVKDIVNGVITGGFQGLVTLMIQTMAVLLTYLARFVFWATAPTEPDKAFYLTYNSASGILLLFLLLYFIFATVINGLRVNGRTPLYTLAGLIRAMLGILFSGGIAWVILAAWDDATTSLIKANADTKWDASMWVTALSNLTGGGGTMLIAGAVAFLCCVGLLVTLITQTFRGELATGAALLGSAAAVGQVSETTKHWWPRWFWTVNALGASRYFDAQLWIYGSRSSYESDDLRTALKGLLLIWMMALAPWIMLRLLTIIDGYLADVNAGGVLHALGAQAAGAAGAAGDGPGSSGSSGESGRPALVVTRPRPAWTKRSSRPGSRLA
jgi:hypothetical protein